MESQLQMSVAGKLSGENLSGELLSETSEVLRKQLENAQAQLAQARRMATIGELTSTTTHEFNNLLMTIINYAKLGLRHKDEASRDKALQRIHDAAAKATKLTSSILSMARNRSGQFEPTDLRLIVEDSLLLLEREFRKYRVWLDKQLDEVPPIIGSGNDLQRMIINLLVNARQATKEGGQVKILLQHDVAQSEVVFTVRDTGVGIAPEILPKIFEPFFSTKAGPDASGKGGTGVGLACCKETVDAHQGRIRVESSVGKGTAFIIRFPSPKTSTENLPEANQSATQPVFPEVGDSGASAHTPTKVNLK